MRAWHHYNDCSTSINTITMATTMGRGKRGGSGGHNDNTNPRYMPHHLNTAMLLLTPLIQLQSILHTYSDTFHNSTDVSKMFRSRRNLCYNLHFALFCCDFLTTGLTCWLRTPIYHSNNSISWEIVSTHSSASTTCVREMHTFPIFAHFCDICAFLQF